MYNTMILIGGPAQGRPVRRQGGGAYDSLCTLDRGFGILKIRGDGGIGSELRRNGEK